MTFLVGLDIGTTSAKAVVFTLEGDPVGEGRRVTPWRSTSDGTEMDAGDLLAAAVGALNDAVASTPGNDPIRAIGLTSMGESGVLVDGHRSPITPIIAWHDRRDDVEVGELHDLLGERFGSTTGKPLRGQFSLTKHRWLTRHRPEIRNAVRRFNVAEFIATSLGGEEACELSLASRTGWFDIKGQQWWPDALDYSGAPVSLMPPLVEAGTPVGRVTSDLVGGRAKDAVLTLAGHDHQAAALGAGATRPGAELDSCGTAEALVRSVPPTLSPEEILTLAEAGVTTDWSIQPGLWSLLAATEGGLALQRILGLLGVDRSGLPALDELALSVGTGQIKVSGIGTAAALTVDGIDDSATPGQLWRAAVESATQAAARVHESMAAVAGPPSELVVTGGWSHSRAVMAAKQQSFGAYRRSNVHEAGARGAAILAARAAGIFSAAETFQDPDQV